jgi:predicted acylesterase/phospholipase RssA
LKIRVLSSSRVLLARRVMMNSLTTHSRRETLPFSRSKTSTSKRKVKMLTRKSLSLSQLLPPRLRVVLRARRRLPQSQLLRLPRAKRLKNPLVKSDKALTRSLNTLLANQLRRRKELLPRLRVRFLLRNQLLLERRLLLLCPHLVVRSQLRLLIK